MRGAAARNVCASGLGAIASTSASTIMRSRRQMPFLRGLPAGRVAEMLGNERLGQQAQQEMAEDVCPGATGIFARRSRQTDAALEMLEGNLDAPSQSIESADRREWILIAVERCDDDDPFGRDQRLGS